MGKWDNQLVIERGDMEAAVRRQWPANERPTIKLSTVAVKAHPKKYH